MSTVCGWNTSRRKDRRDDELPGDMRDLLREGWKGQTRKQINIVNSRWEQHHVGVREQKKKILNNIISNGQRRSKNIHLEGGGRWTREGKKKIALLSFFTARWPSINSAGARLSINVLGSTAGTIPNHLPLVHYPVPNPWDFRFNFVTGHRNKTAHEIEILEKFLSSVHPRKARCTWLVFPRTEPIVSPNWGLQCVIWRSIWSSIDDFHLSIYCWISETVNEK